MTFSPTFTVNVDHVRQYKNAVWSDLMTRVNCYGKVVRSRVTDLITQNQYTGMKNSKYKRFVAYYPALKVANIRSACRRRDYAQAFAMLSKVSAVLSCFWYELSDEQRKKWEKTYVRYSLCVTVLDLMGYNTELMFKES